MRTRTKNQILGYFRERLKKEPRREPCGLIVADGVNEKFIPCENTAPIPESDLDDALQFKISKEDYVDAFKIGKVIAVVHAHPNGSCHPSQADLVGCERSGVPWHIVGMPSEAWMTIEPNGYKAPLLGREFFYGVLDCYTLIQDYFDRTHGIVLPNFEHEFGWWKKGKNYYMELFAECGFRQIGMTEVRKDDCFLMQMRSDVANHAAIYMGNEIILHHAQGFLSGEEVYGEDYQRRTVCVLRNIELENRE